MKKVLFAALFLIGVSSFAQDGPAKGRKHDRVSLSPAQRSDLRVKELTLELGLNASQQKEIAAIIAEQENKREAYRNELKANREKAKPTADEVYAKKSKMLDEKIAEKEKVKKVLTADQFQKWEQLKQNQKKEGKRILHKKKRSTDEPQD